MKTAILIYLEIFFPFLLLLTGASCRTLGGVSWLLPWSAFGINKSISRPSSWSSPSTANKFAVKKNLFHSRPSFFFPPQQLPLHSLDQFPCHGKLPHFPTLIGITTSTFRLSTHIVVTFSSWTGQASTLWPTALQLEHTMGTHDQPPLLPCHHCPIQSTHN